MLADVNAIQANHERKPNSEHTRLTNGEYALTSEHVGRDERQRRQLGRVSARKGALGFRTAAGRARWALTMHEQAHESHCHPSGECRARDGVAAAMMTTMKRSAGHESNGDMDAGKTEELQRALRDLEAPIM